MTAADGGLAGAVSQSVAGAERVARYIVDIAGRAANPAAPERTVNGQPGLVVTVTASP